MTARIAFAQRMLEDHIRIAEIWKRKVESGNQRKAKKEFLEIIASAQKHLKIVNEFRAKKGLRPLNVQDVFPQLKRK